MHPQEAPADLLSALSLLLRDGPLRDEFARDNAGVAARLNVPPADRGCFRRLAPAGLEFQARVLLRKRFHSARAFVPQTCAALGPEAWPRFADYARICWPANARRDAFGFVKAVRLPNPELVSVREVRRLDFALRGRRLAAHLLRKERAVQILVQHRGKLREWLLTVWQPIAPPIRDAPPAQR